MDALLLQGMPINGHLYTVAKLGWVPCRVGQLEKLFLLPNLLVLDLVRLGVVKMNLFSDAQRLG